MTKYFFITLEYMYVSSISLWSFFITECITQLEARFTFAFSDLHRLNPISHVPPITSIFCPPIALESILYMYSWKICIYPLYSLNSLQFSKVPASIWTVWTLSFNHIWQLAVRKIKDSIQIASRRVELFRTRLIISAIN